MRKMNDTRRLRGKTAIVVKKKKASKKQQQLEIIKEKNEIVMEFMVDTKKNPVEPAEKNNNGLSTVCLLQDGGKKLLWLE